MRLPLSWLGEYVDHGLDADALAERLALTGTAVEAVHVRVPSANGNLDNFRVGHVRSVEPHPNADRLRVCRVDVGLDDPVQIVCGAPNVAAGQRVAVALPGAVMPGGMTIGRAKLRGVESAGMICSSKEFGLGTDAVGILVLEDTPVPGTPVAEVLPIADVVLDLEITSNRPDCLSILGLAREVAVVTERELRLPSLNDPPAVGAGSATAVGLTVSAPDLCPRYMARVFEGVRVAPSPRWLRERIEAAGMRAISNVVDITNYVMLLVGQPLHAFDLDDVAGPEIVVRRAAPGERITTLDGVDRSLTEDVLVIADGRAPVAIAGVMGSAACEVSDTTTRVLLEAAAFSGPSVLRTALSLGLRTESSARFEKGLPPELPARAMALASALLVEICGATLVPDTLDVCQPIPEREPIVLRHARLDALLGISVAPAASADILTRLGCTVDASTVAHHVVRVPDVRAGDLTREVDLIEEVARVNGVDRIPAILPRVGAAGGRTLAQRLRERIADRLVTRGYHEVVSYRFVAEGDLDRLDVAPDDPRRDLIRLAHPLSEDMAVMRRSMLPGLLRAAAHNQARQRAHGRIFEIGPTYAPAADGFANERVFVAALAFGAPSKDHWRGVPSIVDIHAAIGLADDVARTAGIAIAAEPNGARYFHPTRQAKLTSSATVIGWAGEIAPHVLQAFDVRGPAASIVIDFAALLAASPDGAPQFAPIPTHPVSTRDIAVVVDNAVAATEAVSVARAAGGALVRDVHLFDRFTGSQVGDGRTSLALRLTISDPDRTLTEADIDGAVAPVVDALRETLGAELRGG